MWIELERDLAELFSDYRAPRKLESGYHLDHQKDTPSGRASTYDTPKCQKIFELYSSGHSAKKAGEAVGLPEHTVLRVLNKLGVPLRKAGRAGKISPEKVQRLASLGMTGLEIAKELGVNQSSISRVLRKK